MHLSSASSAPTATMVSNTENIVGWSSWANWPTRTADLGLASNVTGSELTAPGATNPITISDSGDGYGLRAFTTGWDSGAGSKAWQFSFSTLKYGTLKFSCKMMGTNSPFGFYGPRDFKLQYSLNNSTWTDVSGGTLQAGNGNGNFNSLTNVSLPVACENQVTVYLRMLMTSNTSVNGSTVSGGQSHIDDILVTGKSIAEAPTDITLSYLIPPLPPVATNTVVGTLNSVDFNTGDTFTYSLVSGTGSTDNASFSISGNQLIAATNLNNTSYSVRLRSTDDTGLSYEKALSLTLLTPDTFLSSNNFRISTMGGTGSTSFSGTNASTAYNSTNNEFLVVWQGDDNTSPLVDNENEIFGQRINASTGTLVGSRIRISSMGTNGSTSFSASRPDVVWNATNNEYLVVWDGDDNTSPLVDNENEIFGQRIDGAAGSLSGSRIRISSMGTDGSISFRAISAAVTWNATNNEYFVVWQGDDNTSPLVDNEDEIFGQRLAGAAGTLSGSRIRVSTMGTAGNASIDASTPDVAWNATNNEYFVVWRADDDTAPLVDNEFEIYGQRVDCAAGTLTGSRVRISTMGPDGNTSYAASNPRLAWSAANNEYLVVWSGDDNTSPLVDGEDEIFGQRVNATNAALTNSRLRISHMGSNGDVNYDAFTPSVTWSTALSEYVVVWSGDDQSSESVDGENEVFAQRLSKDGVEQGTNDFRVSAMGPLNDANYDTATPTIAAGTAGKFLVIWQGDTNTNSLVDNENEIHGQLLASNSAPSITTGTTLTRTQGASASNATIATVTDVETAAGSLTVTASTVPTGLTISNISNTNGSITADVSASCAATQGNNTVVLTVTDGDGMSSTANLTITVANTLTVTTAPSNQTVTAGQTATFTAAASNANATIQWQVSINGGQFWTDVRNATTTSLSVTTNASHGGNRYRAVFTNCSTTANSSEAVLTVNPGSNANTLGLVISEFRLRGNSAQPELDEYVELYNNTTSDITVSTSDGSAGWAIAALNADGNSATVLVTIPNGTAIPAKSHRLIVNNSTDGYSLASVAAGDQSFTSDIADDTGLALFNTANTANFGTGAVIDAVGFQLTGTMAALFREGSTGLSALINNNGEYVWVRKMQNGIAQDTNSNVADFVLVHPSGNTINGVTTQIGAPGPENSASPVEFNRYLFESLFDTGAAATAAPNRVRDTSPVTNGNLGTLMLRRSFTNNTGVALTKLRFRVIDITNASSGVEADLRLLSSVTATVNGQTVQGLTLEEPPTQSSGGGLNSTVLVGSITAGQSLANGATVNVEFKLGVMRSGRYRFFLNIEALQ